MLLQLEFKEIIIRRRYSTLLLPTKKLFTSK